MFPPFRRSLVAVALSLCTGFLLSPCAVVAAETAATEAGEGEHKDGADVITVYGRFTLDTAMDIPQTVDVLDRSALDDSASATLGDVLRFVPGASRDGSPLDAFGDTYLVRGFAANQTVNGIGAAPLRQARDSIAIERVEILKGPASVLYGQLQPGAVINVVTKQPQHAWASAFTLFGSRYDDQRVTLDLTGPLSADGGLRFRVTGAFDDANSFVDFWHRRHHFVAPVFAADLSDKTTLTVEAFHTRNELDGFYNGVPAEGTVLANPNGKLRRSLSLTDPGFDPSIREDSDVSFRVEHHFSDTVRYRVAGSWSEESLDEEGVFGVLGWDEPQRTLTRAVLTATGDGRTRSVYNDLAIDAVTGRMQHALVLGLDHSEFERDTVNDIGLTSSLDLFAPSYQSERPEVMALPDFSSRSDETSRSDGVFVQDRVTLTDALQLVGGLRHSRYRQHSNSLGGDSSRTRSEQTQNEWTSRLGLLYAASERTVLFANRTTSFLPVAGVTASGDALAPETGVQHELGLKTEWAQQRVALSAALYHLQRGDVAVSDRDNPSALVAIGEQVAKGFDASLRARFDDWQLQAGYAYTKASTTEDTNAELVGKRIRNVPKHSFTLQSNYALTERGRIGAGLTYTGKRAGDIEDSFELPSYWRADLFADYTFSDALTLAVRIDNVTDEEGYSHSFSQFEVWPDTPRSYKLTVTAHY